MSLMPVSTMRVGSCSCSTDFSVILGKAVMCTGSAKTMMALALWPFAPSQRRSLAPPYREMGYGQAAQADPLPSLAKAGFRNAGELDSEGTAWRGTAVAARASSTTSSSGQLCRIAHCRDAVAHLAARCSATLALHPRERLLEASVPRARVPEDLRNTSIYPCPGLVLVT